MIKKCANCGSNNIAIAQFCSECGHKLEIGDKHFAQLRREQHTTTRRIIIVLIILALVSILLLPKLHIVLSDSSLITVTWKKNLSFKNTILDLQTIEQKMAFIIRSGARGTDEINIIELCRNLKGKGILPTKTSAILEEEKSNVNIYDNSSLSNSSQVQQSTQIEEGSITTNHTLEISDIHQIRRPAIIYAPGVNSDNVALWLTPVPYTGIAGRYYEGRRHGSVQNGQRVTILYQVKRGQIAGTHSIKVSGMTYKFASKDPNVDDESLIETEDGVQGWIMTQCLKEVQNEDPQKYTKEPEKSQIPRISSLPPNLTLDENVWYTGIWNSNIYNRSERPKTVGIRIELIDNETGMPISGARVYMRGSFIEEHINISEADKLLFPKPSQEREFALGAVSDDDGVVVFALSWEKEYPWRSGGPAHYDVHTSWIRAIDDIEKVQYIEIRHPNFKFVQAPFDFSHLLEFGQNKNSEGQSPGIFQEFEDAWHREIGKPGVKFCVLNLGTSFNDFGNNKCKRPEFFEMIKKKDFGTVYQQPSNWFSVGEYPQSECGPYFIYLLQIEVQHRSGQIDINIRRQRY